MRYEKCPKCAFGTLPEDQSFPAACPRCGLILAKFGAAPAAGSRSATSLAAAQESESALDEDSRLARWLGAFTYVPDQVLRSYWILRIVGIVAMTLATLWLLAKYDLESGHGGLWLVHAFITPFHEVRNRDLYAAALMLWVLGYSVLAMASYMFDAWNPQMTLLTGRTGDNGGHDWIDLFGDMGLLPRAQPIGRAFQKLAYVVQFAAIGWAAWLVAKQSAHLSDSAFAEEERPGD